MALWSGPPWTSGLLSSNPHDLLDTAAEAEAVETALEQPDLPGEREASQREREDDPFLCDRVFEDHDDNYWLSEEQEQELNQHLGQEPPEPSEWDDVFDNETRGVSKTVRVTVNAQRTEMWEQCRREINHMMKNLGKAVGKNNREDVELRDVILHLFGRSSKLAVAFEEHFNIYYHDFAHFIVTFLTTCRFGKTLKNLNSCESFDKEKKLMDIEVYDSIWRKIKDTATQGRTTTPFYETLENAFNIMAKRLFIEGFDFRLLISLDDDKDDYNFTKNTEMSGLKQQQRQPALTRSYTCYCDQKCREWILYLKGAECNCKQADSKEQ